MISSTTCLRAAAMLCGCTLIASQVLQNMEHLGRAAAYSGLGLAAIAVPIAMAIAVPVMEHCWTDRRYAAAGVTLVVLLFGLTHTFIVALERGAHHREVAAAAKSNIRYDLAKKALDDANARVRALEAEAVVAAKGGCKGTCKATKELLAEAQGRATAAQQALAQVGAPVDQDSMGKRYGYIAHLIDLWHPVTLPLAVELGALVLIGFAFHRGKEEPQPRKDVAPATTKLEEASAEVRKLREAQGGKLGPVREVARQIGHSTMTTHRAMSRA